MNTDMFKDLLFGDDSAVAERYLKLDETQNAIVTRACIAAILEVLYKNNLVTIEAFEKLRTKYINVIENELRIKVFDEIKKMRDGEKVE